MSKVTLVEATGIKDPLLSDNYELLIPNPPAGSAEALRIHCKSASKPGSTIEEQLVEVFGHKLLHVGKHSYSGSMSVTFVENYLMVITTALNDWAQICRSTQTQSGAFKEEYATDATFIIYGQDGAKIGEYLIKNIWPKTVPDHAFDSSASALEAATEFAFDWIEKKS